MTCAKRVVMWIYSRNLPGHDFYLDYMKFLIIQMDCTQAEQKARDSGPNKYPPEPSWTCARKSRRMLWDGVHKTALVLPCHIQVLHYTGYSTRGQHWLVKWVRKNIATHFPPSFKPCLIHTFMLDAVQMILLKCFIFMWLSSLLDRPSNETWRSSGRSFVRLCDISDLTIWWHN